MSYLAATMLTLSLVLSSLAHAQDVDLKKLKEPVKPPRSSAPASGMKACPEYGAGFYKMAGSDTCVRIGGSVDVGVGMSGTRR